MLEIVAALLAFAGTMISTGLTNKQNREINENNNAFNAEQAEIAREYDSLPEQMERARIAGINPVAVAQSGSGVMSSPSTSASASSPLSMINPSSAISDMISSLGSAANNFANANLTNTTAGAKLNLMNQELANAKLIGTQLQLGNEYQSIINKYADQGQQLTMSATRTSIWESRSRIRQNDQNLKNLKYQLEHVYPEEVNKLISDKNLNNMDIAKIVEEINQMHFSNEEIIARTNLLGAQTDAQTTENEYKRDLIERTLAQYDAEISKIMSDTGLTYLDIIQYHYNHPVGTALNLAENTFGPQDKLSGLKTLDDYGISIGSEEVMNDKDFSNFLNMIEKLPVDQRKHFMNLLYDSLKLK